MFLRQAPGCAPKQGCLNTPPALSEAIPVLLEPPTCRRSRTTNSYSISLSPSYYGDASRILQVQDYQNITRRLVRQDDLYKYFDGSNWSDGESSSNEDDDEVFDVEANNNEYKTDLSDSDYIDINYIDVEDAAKFFEGNLYGPEYYIRGIHEFKESAFDGQD
ncbi:hypothetical protein QBC43DRAFT_285960 [Cladorrhinum sp. PSN259]|nr:hypothetical protein QBC43DRAFT_285960 [Cladorrhinum sp. PSN259]